MISMGMQLDIVKNEKEQHPSGPYKVQVLDRAVSILEILSNAEDEMSLGELTTSIGLHKSTVHRLLMVLESHRLVDKSPLYGRYRLGLKLFELGSRAVANIKLRERARPRLVWLANQVGETVHLCILDRGEILLIERIQPERSIRLSSRIGMRGRAHSNSAGKAILAHLPEGQVRAILEERGMDALTPKTITSPDALMAELALTRERGYAFDDEEAEEGVRGLAMPIFGIETGVVASISALGPAYRFDEAHRATTIQSLKTVALELSEHMGAIKPPIVPQPL